MMVGHFSTAALCWNAVLLLLQGSAAAAVSLGDTYLPMQIPLWAFHHKWLAGNLTTSHLIDKIQSRSQFGEELYLLQNYFYGIGRGTFLELGALDGIQFGNTVGLERDLGWMGMMIEGSPGSYQKLIKNRHKQLLINSVICEEVKTVHYFDYASGFDNPAVFGIWEFMNDGFKEAWYRKYRNGDLPIPESSAVPCVPLGMILKYFHVKHINFFSLDVEGGELGVLKSIDFDEVSFDVICCEGHTDEVKKLLESKGYTMTEQIGYNRWFIHSDFKRKIAPDGVKIKETLAEP